MEINATNAVPFETDSGYTFYVEVSGDINDLSSHRAGGGQLAGGGGKAKKALLEVQEVGDTIAEVCRAIHERVGEVLNEVKPDEMTLEFGVKLAGKAGIPLVTEGSAEATFKINAKWKK